MDALDDYILASRKFYAYSHALAETQKLLDDLTDGGATDRTVRDLMFRLQGALYNARDEAGRNAAAVKKAVGNGRDRRDSGSSLRRADF